jgi:hypothetical protein
VPPGGTLKPGRQAGQALLAHLAEEGEREMPELPAGPAQVVADHPEGGAHRVQVIKGRGRRHEPDE